MSVKEDWKCCKCPKTRASKHEVLWSFGKFGNNPYKKDLGIQEKDYCEEHFKEIEEQLDAKFNQESNG